VLESNVSSCVLLFFYATPVVWTLSLGLSRKWKRN